MGVEKAEEEEGERRERFFCKVHEFLTDYTNFLVSSAPVVSSPHVDTNILTVVLANRYRSISSVPASSLSPIPIIHVVPVVHFISFVPASSPVTVPAPVIPAATVGHSISFVPALLSSTSS